MRQLNVRLDDKVMEHLSVMCQTLGVTQREQVSALIESAYDKLLGNPQLMQLLDSMRGLKKQLDEMNGIKP